MPRYFFNIVEGERKTLLRDSDGVDLPNLSEAKKEALGLARDISKHNLPTQTSRIVVSNSSGQEVTTVRLSDVRTSKIPHWLERGLRIAVRKRILAKKLWFGILVVALLGLAPLALTFLARQEAVSYHTASAPSEGAFLAVRFVPNATVQEIDEFLGAYKARSLMVRVRDVFIASVWLCRPIVSPKSLAE